MRIAVLSSFPLLTFWEPPPSAPERPVQRDGRLVVFQAHFDVLVCE